MVTINYLSPSNCNPATGPINGEIYVPGSKSYTNRALIIAALAKGTSKLKGILRSDDSYWCIDALKRLGIHIEVEGDSVIIQGCNGKWPSKEGELFIGAAGTIARFLPGALAVAKGGNWMVDGIPQLRERPLKPLIDALRELGGEIEYLTDNPGLPLRVHGTGLQGKKIQIPGNVSSQFLSGLLIASAYADEPVTIEVINGLVQPAYIGITLQLMKQFGAKIEHSEDYSLLTVYPTGYEAKEVVLEADASTACYFLSLAALTQGTIRVTNVGYHSFQPDAKFIDVLEKMGCTVQKTDEYLEVKGPQQLKGGFDVDMKPMSDQALTIGALAPFADAPIHVHNVAHIRSHESDRISVICHSLKAMGLQVEEKEDGFTIYPGELQGTTLDPHDDHRNAMVFGLLGTKVPHIHILDPGCVSKTCPAYFEELRKLGLDVELK
ncbi:3-phosphoshikimate 1-carboxyvinyltransferase [Caldalkalibacillus mannanilyticus]|uniref:3-phosphoshikimate 1-carboxyvinyltransferase n=1 Tax=Caldalkalibacillus mannanilyticus TaxID=1418 RepID=UPI000AB8869E|nr:3-phosphoshikimate 1-carboxyvinyltransferase [Caldalkalibacillus mannanilyticus]